jgi:hypothetical protein
MQVPIAHSERAARVTGPKPTWGRCRTGVPAALLVAHTLPFGAIAE